MPKKYLKCDGLDLLSRFDISYISTVINSRCNRVLCSCGKVIDADDSDKECECKKNGKYPDTAKNTYTSMTEGSNSVKRNLSPILHEPRAAGEEAFYYEELVAYVDQRCGTISLSVKKNDIMTLSPTAYRLFSGYKFDSISVASVEAAINDSGIKCPDFDSLLRAGKLLDFTHMDKLQRLSNCIESGFEILKDWEFISTHTQCARDLAYPSYYGGRRSSSYTKPEDLCERYEIPVCLVEYLKDPYFKNFIGGYSDIRALDNYPDLVKQMFGYYIAHGKMNKSSVHAFLTQFKQGAFETPKHVECFINFVKKNLYMGDNVFLRCKKVFNYIKDNNLSMDEDHCNWKYFCVCGGMSHFATSCLNGSKAIADDFAFVRETQGIMSAVKRLLAEVKTIAEEG